LNIDIYSNTTIESVEGEKGDFTVTLKKTPRFIDATTCTGCGECSMRCPVSAIDEYNLGLSDRKAIYIDYPQAIPLSFAIDQETCIGCGLCEKMCLAGAIRYADEPRTEEVKVGSIILSVGTKAFDPSELDFLGYGRLPNVVTSPEFERILSASGPYFGHLMRPLDRQEPQKVAWLQCVGSRDINRCQNAHCSSVCCMYAIKEAIIAKEHSGEDLDCAIFYMDIRTHGKGFEEYYNKARDELGVRFVRSRVHSITENVENGDVMLEYVDDHGQRHIESFDMVVLSVGLEVDPKVMELAERLGVELTEGRFCQTSPFAPVATSREGVFVAGAFQGPKDIPSSVIDASAGAAAAAEFLGEARYTQTRTKEVVPEKSVDKELPRIGVFVCKCGSNIAGVVNVPAVRDYAASLPYVEYVVDNLYTCSQDTQDVMTEIIKEKDLNRVVVASCTPKTHEALFQETLINAGLNKYLFEMANIRNQDSWVHANAPEEATEKAKELVRMAVSRVAHLHPLQEKRIPVIQRALVIGGGVAGLNAALNLGNQGYEVVLIEKEADLGGLSRRLTTTIDGSDIQAYLNELVQSVQEHELIQVLTQAVVVSFAGYKGNFSTEVIVGPGMYQRSIEHGVTIIATGAGEYSPAEYLYGEDERVMTQIELAARLEDKGSKDLENVVMIQCVGSRNEDHPNCSRVCCQSAVKNAIHIKEQNPSANVYILHRDIRTYGLLEQYFTKARDLGILFFRYDPESPPQVAPASGGLQVTFYDQILERNLQVEADIVALSAGVAVPEDDDLPSILKLTNNSEGHVLEAHVKMRPVDIDTEGLFVCGMAHSPMLIPEAISQALAAASRASTYLSQKELTLSGIKARVEQSRCAACLVCVRACPYGVPRINEEGVSEIDEALCNGCGICAAECPAKAIELNWYEDIQITSKIDALLEEVL